MTENAIVERSQTAAAESTPAIPTWRVFLYATLAAVLVVGLWSHSLEMAFIGAPAMFIVVVCLIFFLRLPTMWVNWTARVLAALAVTLSVASFWMKPRLPDWRDLLGFIALGIILWFTFRRRRAEPQTNS